MKRRVPAAYTEALTDCEAMFREHREKWGLDANGARCLALGWIEGTLRGSRTDRAARWALRGVLAALAAELARKEVQL